MSHRDRPGSVGVAPVPAPVARLSPSRHGEKSVNGDSWDDFFPALLPGQQADLLALAARQGMLTHRQLPKPEHAPADRARTFLGGLLAPVTAEPLPPARLESFEPIDRQLDAAQLDAIARALSTPDICLIHGGPGTGKTRLIAEITRQSARRGLRVLLIAPGSAAVDAVLARLVDDADVVAVRALGRDERAEELPAASLARTFPAMRRRMLEGGADHARRLRDDAAARQGRARADLAILPEIERHARQHAALAAADDEPTLRSDQLAHEAELACLDEAAAAATAELQQVHQRASELDAQLATAPPTERGWLSKLFGSGRQANQIQEWKTARDGLRSDEERAKRRAEEVAAKRGEVVERWRVERQRRVEDTQRRRDQLEAERAGIAAEIHRLAASLSPDSSLANPLDVEAVGRNVEAAQRSVEQAAVHGEFAGRWGEFLTEHGRELPSRLMRCVTLAAAPLSALASDDVLAELWRDDPFDLLVVDEAHRLAEADLLNAARRTHRWVLVGEPIALLDRPSAIPEARDKIDPRPSTPARPRPPSSRFGGRVSPWLRLWRQLHTDGWFVEHGRSCVRFSPLTASQAARLDVETVADSPDIELRICTAPHGAPELAEVAFAAGATPTHAYGYLYRELNELPVSASAPRWDESPSAIACRFIGEPGDSISLEGGVTLRLADQRIVAIEFDRAAGWDRGRAEAWAAQTLRPCELARTARLTVQHRLHSAPAAFAIALGFDVPASGPGATAAGPVAEFVPVPALSEPQARRRGDIGLNGQQRRLPPLRGGAGLDVDIADPRQRERLPAEIQTLLPPRGFINLLEAEGIIRLLETLLDDLPADRPDSIAVLPMYEAQAQLLRHLASRSPLLTNGPVPVRIVAACQARHLEADWVIVGLTRSHGHRAVSYGDGPHDMACALTRARKRLILVGDPGTLARRAHWDGPLEHLDADAAQRECDWVAALVRLLQGHGPPAVHLCEGPP